MALIRQLFWFLVFVVSTLSFVVLFEHGPDNFGANFTKQVEALRTFVVEQTQTKKDAKAPQ